MSAQIEVIQREHETLKAQVERLVQRRLTEITARRDLSSFHPFFESKHFTDELRRLQTGQEWHKWSVHYEKFGCIHCHARPHEKPHYAGLGFCRTCKKRIQQRLEAIRESLNEKAKNAEQLIGAVIDQEKLARKALGLSERAERRTLPAPAKIGRPKMKPSILRGDSGERLRKLRTLAGMSQAALAKAAGVDRKTIISFERGDHRASPPHCDAIRKVLVEGLVRAFWP